MAQEAIIERAKAHLLQNYRTQPVVIDRGLGTRVWDSDGKSYLDLLGGIATCAMGHCHPEVVKALKAQADKLWHISNVFYSQPQIDLAELLAAASGLERAFFCNSGAEANEALIKLARLHGVEKSGGEEGKCYKIICAKNAFHGRMFGGMSATWQSSCRRKSMTACARSMLPSSSASAIAWRSGRRGAG